MRDNALLEFQVKTLEEKVSSMKEYEHRLEAERDHFKEKYEVLKETAGDNATALAEAIFALRKKARESNWEKYPDRMGK